VFGALELFIKGMKFSDAIIYMQAVQEGTTPVYTFDREDFKGKAHAVLLAKGQGKILIVNEGLMYFPESDHVRKVSRPREAIRQWYHRLSKFLSRLLQI